VSEASDGGRDGGVPWAAVFDPEANARALEQIQRRGLQAAGDLVDRLVAAVDGDGSKRGEQAPRTNGAAAANGSAAPTGSDPFGWWVYLMTQTLQAMARLSVPDTAATDQPTGGPVWLDVVSGRDSGTLALAVERSAGGPTVAGELWLHNPSDRSVGPLHLHVGELGSPEGLTLPTGLVCPDPPSVSELPARSSRGVSVAVAAPSELAPGCYRGLLQVDGAAAVAFRVELNVTGPA
jgi:hypothetical protein